MPSMKHHAAVAAIAAAVLSPGLRTAPSAAAAGEPAVSGGTWGTAAEVPGLAALSHGHGADLRAVSCGSAGNCTAAGSYTDAAGHGQAYVVNQVNGTWHNAQEIPGTAALNKGGFAGVYSVSCASAGNCAAGGFYHDGAGRVQAFVASETGGTWHTAEAVPGLIALNAGGLAVVLSVSCASAGNCAAGGYYHASPGREQAYVVSQANGTWGTARQVPGTAALNQGGAAALSSVSCASAGNCSAGGGYLDSTRTAQAFVVGETDGTWGPAEQLPGTAALEGNRGAGTASVSCTAAGACGAGGTAGIQPYVASEAHGTWGAAAQMPGIVALDKGRPAEMAAVSCASAGNCGAGGDYEYGTGKETVFVSTQANGTWRPAEEVPGIAALNKGGNALIDMVSCGLAGNCGGGGYYQDGSGHLDAFVVSETNGTWRAALEVPGTAALDKGGVARVFSVSCASAGQCSAGGIYTDRAGVQQAFVVTES
jgi:hypothetical protein